MEEESRPRSGRYDVGSVRGRAVGSVDRPARTRTQRALPSRRVQIPQADGSPRPLGIAALEDQILTSTGNRSAAHGKLCLEGRYGA